MFNISNYRITKDMKYEALYSALGFYEYEKNIFTKQYKGFDVSINTLDQSVNFNNKISIINGKFLLNDHKRFVILECIDKLLLMGYSPVEIIVDLNNEFDLHLSDMYIKCYEWDQLNKDDILYSNKDIKFIYYESRLISGVIERNYIVSYNNNLYNSGIFESNNKDYVLSNNKIIIDHNFIIEGNKVVKYIGKEKKVTIPEGIVSLAPCLFWDNQTIEEVILPDSLLNLSGDTFYNASKLRLVNIPKNVESIGNNPFAGCPNLVITNESDSFNLIDGVLYDKDCHRLIYFPINYKSKYYKVLDDCKTIGKHAFYLCNNLELIDLPKTIIKIENNPFSGCEKLDINNNSKYYNILDKVIYDRDYESVIGCLNSINTNNLVLKDVKRICRNSFWNCKGITNIVLPKTLESIGYNPFVGCRNIHFINNNENYIVKDAVLYNNDMSKIICYPQWKAVGDIHLLDSVLELERGAFSGCDLMTKINLHNVNRINKACFTNCNSLTNVYCSDLVKYIGEWSFAHCNKLNKLSVCKETIIDNNATLNSNVEICIRDNRDNLIIESDNIYTLKSMLINYSNKIKSILIDPPYNSKINYINYNDEFNDYNDFMYKRLFLAKKLLTNDGFLIINIDKGECKNLANICKKLFYKVKVHKWEKIHSYFDINRKVIEDKKLVKYEYIIICYKSKYSTLNLIKQPYIKNNSLFERYATVPKVFRCFGTNSSAKDEIKEIFGRRDYFKTPKPLKLIKELVRATTNDDDIVLDFFAGSGTTGHAIINLNNETNTNRKFILISNNESDICRKVTLERIKKYTNDYIFID